MNETLNKTISETNQEISNTENTQNSVNENLFLCNICNYSSKNKYLLKRHLKIHTKEKPLECPHCDRSFREHCQLSNHVKIHTGTKPHVCKHCDLSFTTRGELTRHDSYKHNISKPHKCPHCDYASVERNKLTRHLRIHTDERPYLCPHCDYASRDTFKLKRHIRIHTGERPYECPICESRFSQSNSLKVHLKIHENDVKKEKLHLKCSYCDKKYKSEIDLANHMKTKHLAQVLEDNSTDDLQKIVDHEKKWIQVDEWFICEICTMKFAKQDAVEDHVVKHTGDRPFKCDICSCAFSFKFALRAHVSSHSLEADVSIERTRGDINENFKSEKNEDVVQNESLNVASENSNDNIKNVDLSVIETPTKSDIEPVSNSNIISNEKEKENECTLCWRQFRSRAILNRHLKKLHKIVYNNEQHDNRTNMHGSFLAQLNETAISQNNKNSNTSITFTSVSETPTTSDEAKDESVKKVTKRAYNKKGVDTGNRKETAPFIIQLNETATNQKTTESIVFQPDLKADKNDTSNENVNISNNNVDNIEDAVEDSDELERPSKRTRLTNYEENDEINNVSIMSEVKKDQIDHRQIETDVEVVEDHRQIETNVEVVEDHRQIETNVEVVEDHRQIETNVEVVEDHRQIETNVEVVEDHRQIETNVEEVEKL